MYSKGKHLAFKIALIQKLFDTKEKSHIAQRLL